VIIDLKPSPPQVRTTILGPTTQTVPGNMVWLDHDRIGFFPWSGENARAIIFDRPLHELGGINNWSAWTSLLVGDVMIGVGQGGLTMADLPNGPARVLQQFESPQTIALATLPGITLVPAPHVAPLATGDADLPILPLGRRRGCYRVAGSCVLRRPGPPKNKRRCVGHNEQILDDGHSLGRSYAGQGGSASRNRVPGGQDR
jgi:hypothetical protein